MIRHPVARQKDDRKKKIVKSMERAKLTPIDNFVNKFPHELSGGEQQKALIARSLVQEAKILLLDEPTAGMNAAETHIVGKLILKLRDEGLTILVIEHDMELISQVCDEVVALNFGQLIADGTPAEIKANSAVIEAYLGEEEEAAPA